MNVILTGSQKNYIGKTVISIMIGIELSKTGKNVLMIDLSTGKVKMSEYLNVFENIIYDVADVLMDTCLLEQALIEINENLCLLPCPRISGKIDVINKESFDKLLKFSESYDYIIIDGDILTHSYIDFSKIQNVLSINNNDFSCVKEINTDRIISSKAENFIVAINKYNNKKASNGMMMNLKDIEKLYEEITGEQMSKYYRPPQGKFNEENLKMADELGYKTIFWSLAYVDWYKDKQPTKEYAFSKLIPRIHPGAVVLLHSTSDTNEQILSELILKWKELGYTFGTLDDLIASYDEQ
jgi:septum formation inhibitor-activating ATPase MinD